MINYDQSQRAFCESPARFLRLLAPAGSGKTMSILGRSIRLIELDRNGYDRILIVTFTRSARDELARRISTDSEYEIIRDRVVVRTLNQWGYSFIRQHQRSKINLISDASKFTDNVRDIVLPLVRQSLPYNDDLHNSRSRLAQLLDVFDQIKTTAFRHNVDELGNHLRAHIRELANLGLGKFWEENVVRVLRQLKVVSADRAQDAQAGLDNLIYLWRDCTEALWDAGYMTIEDQKYWSLLLLEDGAGIDFWQGQRYSHIIVDEFQDINPLDLHLIRRLQSIHGSTLALVGDDDQAIFEWRGSSPIFILNPSRFFGLEFDTHVLETNYRSPQNIVTMSQKLIKNNRNRVEKSVRSERKSNAVVEWQKSDSHLSSLEKVIHRCRDASTKSVPNTLAILARKRSQVVPIQLLLLSESIRFDADVDLNVLTSRVFTDLLAITECVAQPNALKEPPEVARAMVKCLDRIGIYRLPAWSSKGLFAHIIRNQCRTFGEGILAIQSYPGTLNGSASEYFVPMLNISGAKSMRNLLAILERDFAGFKHDYGEKGSDIFFKDPPLFYLREFIEAHPLGISEFSSLLQRARSINSDTDGIRIGSGESEPSLPIQIMTAHRSKGKEFARVILLDVNDGFWPSCLATGEAELEAERRLFYVAVTRAREELLLLTVGSARGQSLEDSPYVSELGISVLVDRTTSLPKNPQDQTSVRRRPFETRETARKLAEEMKARLAETSSSSHGDRESEVNLECMNTSEKRGGIVNSLRIGVERDEAAEEASGIKVEGVTAHYFEKSHTVRVIGELSSLSRKTIKEYKEIHVVVYTEDGFLVGRGFTNFFPFGIRQSFALELKTESALETPVKAKVFPAK